MGGSGLPVGYFGIFTNANLTGANLAGNDLRASVLAGANLTGANLSNIYVETCNLCRVGPPGMDLVGANLTRTDLEGSNLGGIGFDLGNNIWSQTTCPDGTNSDYVGHTCVNNLGP
jgi:uncharacterized protein YjbI with pentapeptide repeats